MIRTGEVRRNNATRKVVAIGDLHGDYFRMVRLMTEGGVLDPVTIHWRPEADQVDVVLVGDYVDWRYEQLEGNPQEWKLGISRIVGLLLDLAGEVEELSGRRGFDSHLHTLMGNHDMMMWEGFQIVERIGLDHAQLLFNNVNHFSLIGKLLEKLMSTPEKSQDVARLLNWYTQGGEMTIASYGGMKEWQDAMTGRHGEFFSRHLKLGVVLNNRLYCHSLPDDETYLMPLTQLAALPSVTYEKALESFVWGRRIWGYDVFSGRKLDPPSEADVDRILAKLGVQSVVIGHTPMGKSRPYYAYDGKVINLDTHGTPGSSGFVEEYKVDSRRGRTSGKQTGLLHRNKRRKPVL
ncbi:MAG: metallophosphoesterase [Armatimonadetes bacterium]|nr:metallophosphoesterase [Armatimonadota bacterium]